MQKTNKIILRKRITNYTMIINFEKFTGMRLPLPPSELPIERHCKVLTWTMDLTKDASIKKYKKLLELFDLPFKDNNQDELFFKMKRVCWWDVLFEVYEHN